jgi:hypothetical protein
LGRTDAAVALLVALRRLASHHRRDGYATGNDLRATATEGAALAIAWSLPPLFFGAGTATAQAYGLWLILSVLMAATALAMAPLAFATLIFLGVLGTTVAAHLVLGGTYAAAGATVLFTLILMAICVNRAHALIAIRAGQIALEERDETVSLLLPRVRGHRRRLAVGNRCCPSRRQGVAALRVRLRARSRSPSTACPFCRCWRVRPGKRAISPTRCACWPTR